MRQAAPLPLDSKRQFVLIFLFWGLYSSAYLVLPTTVEIRGWISGGSSVAARHLFLLGWRCWN